MRMVRFFEKIPVNLPEESLYAHFIIPDAMIIFDTMKHTLTLIKIAYLDEKEEREKSFENASADLETLLERINAPKRSALKEGPPQERLRPPRLYPGNRSCDLHERGEDYQGEDHRRRDHPGGLFTALFLHQPGGPRDPVQSPALCKPVPLYVFHEFSGDHHCRFPPPRR